MYIDAEEIEFVMNLNPGSRYEKNYRHKGHMTIWKTADNAYIFSFHFIKSNTVTRSQIDLQELLLVWFETLQQEKGRKEIFYG